MKTQWPKVILTYHKIKDVKQFESHLQLLEGRQDVLLTFDDGDRSVYENAFPLLKKYGRKAILFIITGLVDTNEPFWWDEVEFYAGKEKAPSIVRSLKNMRNEYRLVYLNNLRSQHPEKKSLPSLQITTAELKEMNDNGIIIANHSHTHPMFDKCTVAELKSEMESSLTYFKKAGFGEPFLFAYPNGNTDKQAEEVLQQYGITGAFLFDHKLNTGQHPLRISRLSMDDHTSLWKMRFILSGVHSALLPIRKAIRKWML